MADYQYYGCDLSYCLMFQNNTKVDKFFPLLFLLRISHINSRVSSEKKNITKLSNTDLFIICKKDCKSTFLSSTLQYIEYVMSDVYQKYICKKKNRNGNNNPYNALINHQRPAGGVGISRDVIGVYIVLLSLAVINNDAEN